MALGLGLGLVGLVALGLLTQHARQRGRKEAQLAAKEAQSEAQSKQLATAVSCDSIGPDDFDDRVRQRF